MSPLEHLSSRWPGIEERVLDRLVSDVDGKTHALREGLSKDEARGILLLSAKTARECGLKLVLTQDEQNLMGRKFVVGSN
jgi:hypothetical protein